ncbi:MAG: hypothetical protein NC123_20385 [Butyrivibrio sp.]|nr:hypothetical protein [Butyrivibrio sp.]
MRKWIHPLILRILQTQKKHELHILNQHPQIMGNAIYAINHSCRYDMPYAAEVIKRHTYVLVGKQRLDVIDRIAFFLNGAIYVDRKSKSDKVTKNCAIIGRNGNPEMGYLGTVSEAVKKSI